MANTEEVCLKIEDTTIKIAKDLLIKHSLYFSAMFSGYYCEADQKTIEVKIIDVKSMQEAIEYMKNDTILPKDVTERIRLLRAAQYLQMEGLMIELEKMLMATINIDNWLLVLEAAEATNKEQLAQRAAAVGLYSLENMFERVSMFQSLQKLHWYLSHNCIIGSELEIFKLGMQWINVQTNAHKDSVLVVLGSLCLTNLNIKDLNDILTHPIVIAHAIANSLVKVLHKIVTSHGQITKINVIICQPWIVNEFSQSIYEDLFNMMESDVKRGGAKADLFITASQMGSDQFYRNPDPEYIYRFNRESGKLEPWTMVGSGMWGWSWTVWGSHMVVIAGGEYGRGTGRYERRVRVYDASTLTWTQHDVEISSRRHCGLLVIGHTLYLFGGVGLYRTILSSCEAYDLRSRTVSSLPDLPERIQSPCVTSYNGNVYVSGHEYIYILSEDRVRWIFMCPGPCQVNVMHSWLGDLGVVRIDSKMLFRISLIGLEVTRRAPRVVEFKNDIAAICSSGDVLYAFTHSLMRDEAYVESYDCNTGLESCTTQDKLNYHPHSGCHAIYIDLPQSGGYASDVMITYNHLSPNLTEDTVNTNPNEPDTWSYSGDRLTTYHV